MKRIVSGLMMAVYVLTMVAGCNQAPSTGNGDLEQTAGNSDDEAQKTWVLEDGSAKQSLLNANIMSPQVAAFADTLASWEYSYRPQNSVVMIATIFDEASSADIPNLPKKYPDYPDSVRKNLLAEQDTVVWQVFENAVFDSSKHTAVITGYHNGSTASIFVEVDVTTGNPTLIRGGVLSDSGWTIDEPLVLGFWGDLGSCMLAATARCAIKCLFGGPAYLQCLAGCEAWAASYCTVAAVFRWWVKNN
jgi:hypothetical protein